MEGDGPTLGLTSQKRGVGGVGGPPVHREMCVVGQRTNGVLDALVRQQATHERDFAASLGLRWREHIWVDAGVNDRRATAEIRQRVDHKPALRQMGIDPPAQTRAADPPHAAAAMVGHEHALPERTRQHGRQRRQTGARLVAVDHVGPQEGGYEPRVRWRLTLGP